MTPKEKGQKFFIQDNFRMLKELIIIISAITSLLPKTTGHKFEPEKSVSKNIASEAIYQSLLTDSTNGNLYQEYNLFFYFFHDQKLDKIFRIFLFICDGWHSQTDLVVSSSNNLTCMISLSFFWGQFMHLKGLEFTQNMHKIYNFL